MAKLDIGDPARRRQLVTHLTLLNAFRSRRTPRRSEPSPRSEHTIACPACGKTDGFLLDLDGVSYRVLEDSGDTDLIEESANDTVVTCEGCRTTLTSLDALALAQETGCNVSLETGAPERMGPRRNRIHSAGKALLRVRADGRTLPVCPECNATHDFFVDLDGVAYHVLEDDNDTDLLDGAPNLLCVRCNAVFDL